MGLKKEISFFLGSGGVGKTTLSALYALKKARENPNKKIKLITIDPSQRLKDLFSKESGGSYKSTFSNLELSMGNRKGLFKQFLGEVSQKKKINPEKVEENIFFQSLMNNLAVSQEFTSLYELERNYSGKADCIIFDTPPLQNTADFLKGSETLKSFFSGPIVNFFVMEKDRGPMFYILNRARRLGLEALSRLTGSDFVDQLALFFDLTEEIKDEILNVVSRAENILQNEVQFNLVCKKNELSLKSIRIGLDFFKGKEFMVKSLIINHFNGEEGTSSRLINSIQNNTHIVEVPTFSKEPVDEKSLLELGEQIEFK